MVDVWGARVAHISIDNVVMVRTRSKFICIYILYLIYFNNKKSVSFLTFWSLDRILLSVFEFIEIRDEGVGDKSDY